MSLPYTNPSDPSATNPYFQDNSLVRGDQMRNNNVAIWGNFTALDWASASAKTSYVNADLFGLADSAASFAYKPITGQNLNTTIRIFFQSYYSWTAYTPVFTGFGTCTSIQCFWRPVGDSIEINGYFVTGTTDGSVASVSLPGGFTSKPAKLSNDINIAGTCIQGNAASLGEYMLITPSATVLNFGRQDASFSGLAIRNGNEIAGSSVKVTFNALVPVL